MPASPRCRLYELQAIRRTKLLLGWEAANIMTTQNIHQHHRIDI
jgi:hypothetical protein